jgi:hypothetical protein
MAVYFDNQSNKLDSFFNLEPTKTLRVDKKYLEERPGTFVKSVGNNISDCEIECCLSMKLKVQFWLRIYEVKPKNKALYGRIKDE